MTFLLNPKIPFFSQRKMSTAYWTKYNLNKVSLFIAHGKYILFHKYMCHLYVYRLPNDIFLERKYMYTRSESNRRIVDLKHIFKVSSNLCIFPHLSFHLLQIQIDIHLLYILSTVQVLIKIKSTFNLSLSSSVLLLNSLLQELEIY